ncbi:MAG: hypothetical protein J5506_09655, partial [Prevotella sp.]|nr:hypothetical protein [Prevotella sp.]
MPETTNLNKSVSVVVDYLPKVNYALLHNGVKCLNYCEIENLSGEDLRHVTVRLTGELVKPAETFVEMLPKGQTVHVSGLELEPDIDGLLQLTEAVSTSFKIVIEELGVRRE